MMICSEQLSLHWGRCWGTRKTQTLVFVSTLVLVLLAIVSLYESSFQWQPQFPVNALTKTSASYEHEEKCNIFIGDWVPNPDAPYYTNKTCRRIQDHQNCMKYGRPDRDFIKWRWKPDGCELPIFDPQQFLELVLGKSMAFVGDSLAQNQMQSLICLLSRVEHPVDVSRMPNSQFKRWKYSNNFTLAVFWAPFLVRSKEVKDGGGLFNLYLDEFDEQWATQIDEFDYVVISAGQWFFRPLVFYENHQIVGCQYCNKENITELAPFYGYRKAFRTVFRAINSRKNFNGITYLRTFSPTHFENGTWNTGGNCVRTIPFKRNETTLEGKNLNAYRVQVEEFKKAQEDGRKRGLKYRLLNTTQATWLRPDGHPNKYWHRLNDKYSWYNDCLHWCLPGPIDAWNDLLLEMLKMEHAL